MKPITLIKLGGSVITRKDEALTARPDIIKAIAKEIAKYYKQNPEVRLILGNGAGSFGHYLVQKYNLKDGMKTAEQLAGYTQVQHSVSQLNNLVTNALLAEGLPVVSVQPSAILISQNGKKQDMFLQSIAMMYVTGIIPVVYGDIILDTKQGCKVFSTEDIFDLLIQAEMPIKEVIHITQVDGVLDKKKVVINEITEENWREVQEDIYAPAGYDVTGGMKHKIETALEYAKKGVLTRIINGEKPDLFNQTGTTISSLQSESLE